MMVYHIRVAVIGDCEHIYRIHVESIKGVCGRDGEQQIQLWVERQSVDRYVDPVTRGRVLVACDDSGLIVGFGHYEFIDNTIMEIKALYVSPDKVGTGIGDMFMKKFLSLAAVGTDSSNGMMTMTVASTRNAIRFYEKYGFISDDEEYVHCERGCVSITCTKMTRNSNVDIQWNIH